MKFYKVLDAECDFCKETYKVVTEIDNIYICRKCANKILSHCAKNENSLTTKEK